MTQQYHWVIGPVNDLDVVTERLVDASLSQLACTRIVIAHWLSTIRDADMILVLEEGTIVERGTHEELLARGGRYAALIRDQLRAEPNVPALTANSRETLVLAYPTVHRQAAM